ncbi:hypothetical protein [uncultured Kordia sp.]|uniref:hypothetical protein n=1 Tax=uncultured Kordia sp. TaxID=507699 RepID=UPI00260D38D1|nr:hypothetical protein [uncultured Kordia sp.]
MRTELETIAYIEKYLLNVLTNAEQQVFEKRMATDPDFKTEVELQEQLVHSLERISLQQTIQSAEQTYRFWKLWKLIGTIAIPILLTLTTWYILNASTETSMESETIPTKVEQKTQEKKTILEKITANPDTTSKKKTSIITNAKTTVYAENIVITPLEKIQSDIFSIATEKDTIVETKNGIVFLIPSNTFVDSSQNIVSGNVQLEVKEAIDSHTIMTSGLSTFFNDKPLETGGMFFIEAKKDGKKLAIHPEKEITVDIPTQNYKQGMQLFDGEIKNDGIINWTNPKPLDKALIPQDIFSLNFYPPSYLETLTEKGYDSNDKKFTDSLYYSFENIQEKKKIDKILGYIFKERRRTLDVAVDTVIRDVVTPKKDSVLFTSTKGLDPIKVKTIWNEKYENTFIATKAFEERLRVIHQNCESANSIFDMYVKNIDRNLHEIDEMIVTKLRNSSFRTQFESFAAQRLTNVTNINSEVSKLNDYYIKQQKVYRLALEKTQYKIDSLMDVDERYKAFSRQQLQNYYSNELAVNTKNVAKNIDVKLPRVFNRIQRTRTQNNQTYAETNSLSNEVTSVASSIKKEKRKRRYRASVRTTGWKNIDRIINDQIIASLKNRTNVTIKNKTKQTTITFSNYEVSIENTEIFDHLFVYLIPNEFDSYIKLDAKNNRFTYKLNDLLSYRVYCIAYLNDVPYYIDKTIESTSDELTLSKTTTEALRKQLSTLNTESSSLETEISYQIFKRENKTKVKKYREIIQLKRELTPLVFPCITTIELEPPLTLIPDSSFDSISSENASTSFRIVENSAVYPGCENFTLEADRRRCTEEKIQSFIKENFKMEIFYRLNRTKDEKANFTFTIDTNGIVTNISTRSSNKYISMELKRIIKLLPKLQAGKAGGKKVKAKYTMSLHLSIRR